VVNSRSSDDDEVKACHSVLTGQPCETANPR